MSTAEELLDNLTEDSMSLYTVNSSEEPHIVIGDDRFITVPDMLKRIAVQYDHDIETVTFDCPRYWDDIDISAMKIYINYMRADGGRGMYHVDNIYIDETNIDLFHFTWTISKNVTMAKGTLTFLICAKKTDSDGNEKVHWNTELNREMYISEGLECEEQVKSSYPDVITDLLLRMDEVETGFADNDTAFHKLESDVNTYTDKINQAEANAKEALDRVKGDLREVYDSYFQVGETRPTEYPCIWIDTSNVNELSNGDEVSY